MAQREKNLHRIYVRMSRQGRVLVLRVRPVGWMAGGVAFVLLFLGADPTRSLTYQLFALMFCFVAAAVFSTMFFPARGKARRTVAGTCVPGVPVPLEIEITNTGRNHWRNVQLVEIPPAPVPTLEEFSSTPEPGERHRNAFDRLFIFYRFAWLGERRQTFKVTLSEAFNLAPGETLRVPMRILPLRRGVMELRDLRLAQDDIFGFFRRLKPITCAPNRLAVVPRPAAVTVHPSAGSAARSHPAGESPWHRSGQSDEFLTLREYRPGDPLQHIHWAAFARAGHPIVREFEDVHRPRTALILDTLLPIEGKAFEITRAFEVAVEAAAALAGLLQQGDTLLELLLVQDRAHSFTSGPGHLQMRRLLEILASVQPETVGSLEKLERLAIAHASQCGNAHFVGVQWDEARLKMLTRLRARGLGVQALVVAPEGTTFPDAPSWVRICGPGDAVKHRGFSRLVSTDDDEWTESMEVKPA